MNIKELMTKLSTYPEGTRVVMQSASECGGLDDINKLEEANIIIDYNRRRNVCEAGPHEYRCADLNSDEITEKVIVLHYH